MTDGTRGIGRKELMDRLNKIRKTKVCGYFGSMCDCKFGADLEVHSEETGCPEIMQAQLLLYLITDEEYVSILNRQLKL